MMVCDPAASTTIKHQKRILWRVRELIGIYRRFPARLRRLVKPWVAHAGLPGRASEPAVSHCSGLVNPGVAATVSCSSGLVNARVASPAPVSCGSGLVNAAVTLGPHVRRRAGQKKWQSGPPPSTIECLQHVSYS